MATKAPLETHHHLVPIRVYVVVILILFALMLLTVGISYIQLPDIGGPFTGTVMNQLAALIIAVIKASLVVLFFMGVRWATTLTKLWAMLGFVWLSFFTIMWGDYGTRNIEQVQGWENHESALPRTYEDHTALPASNDINIRPRG